MNLWSRLVNLVQRTPDPLLGISQKLSRTRLMNHLHNRASGLVHRMDWVFVSLALIAGASAFLPRTRWAAVVQAVLALVAVAGIFFKHQHGGRLCEQCVTAFPINAPEYADKRKKRFKAFHSSWVIVPPALACCMASMLLESSWRGVVYMVPWVMQAGLALVARFHSSYQPWCPYCRDGGGGEGEAESAPDPSGGHGRPLPVV